MKNIIRLLLTLFTCSPIFLYSQVSNVKLDSDVYSFLSILSQKGIIEYNDLVKPLSRRYIAEKLIDVDEKVGKLTKLQKRELYFYKAEYGFEIEKIQSGKGIVKRKVNESKSGIRNLEFDAKNEKKDGKKPRDLFDKSWEFEVRSSLNKHEAEEVKDERFTFADWDKYNRLRFFNYKNNLFNLNVSPILGYEKASWEGDSYANLFLGFDFNGEIGHFIGFNFELKQTRQSPRVTNLLYNRFSKNTSIDLQLADSYRLEYSTINVDIGIKLAKWGSLTVGKNSLNWGYAENGKIVLSEKAPPFPYIRLDIKPTDWLTFNYIHAWLNSDLVDTSSNYATWRYEKWREIDKFSYIPKFMAMHSATFNIWNGIDFSIGESAVYSDQLQFAYLIPIMFFDLVDEYLNRNDNYAGASTQLFLAFSSRNNIPNTHLYGSFHADELTPEGLFDPATQYYKFAFTFGGYVIDLPIENLGMRLEYTKVYPGNYRHFIPSLTYESSSSLLGHWIGDNGDLVYGALDYTVFRGLKIKLWSQYIRKGTEAHGNRAYKIQIPQPPFLFTDNIRDRKNYIYYGIDIKYEIYHDIWLKFHYQYIDYEQQREKGKYNSELNRDLSFSFGYGI